MCRGDDSAGDHLFEQGQLPVEKMARPGHDGDGVGGRLGRWTWWWWHDGRRGRSKSFQGVSDMDARLNELERLLAELTDMGAEAEERGIIAAPPVEGLAQRARDLGRNAGGGVDPAGPRGDDLDAEALGERGACGPEREADLELRGLRASACARARARASAAPGSYVSLPRR